MNHKKLIPANGISVAAVAIPRPRLFSHSDESAAPSGMLVRIRISTAPNSSAKITPASAAARGVVSWRGLGLDDIAITEYSQESRLHVSETGEVPIAAPRGRPWPSEPEDLLGADQFEL